MNAARPAWREPMLWLAAGIPLATLVAGFMTLRIAMQSGTMDAAPESVQRTAQTQTSDLSADELAARMGLQAMLSFDPEGRLSVTGLAPVAGTHAPELLLVHPTQAANDIRIPLHRDGDSWRGKTSQRDAAIAWRVQLLGPDRQWRLVARLAPDSNEAVLSPALAPP